ncbi:MAG: hypothetical protein MUE62_02580 [Burkholderiaceae bacterium]|nr:hypothetical protein [Burkholderiaceae bacterium]
MTAIAMNTVRRITSTLAGLARSTKFFSVNSRTTWPVKSSRPKNALASSANRLPR